MRSHIGSHGPISAFSMMDVTLVTETWLDPRWEKVDREPPHGLSLSMVVIDAECNI